MFISFEGVDGVGKTSLMQLVADWLIAQEVKVVVTREPGGTGNAELIRELLMSPELVNPCTSTEALLMFAARSEHLHHTVLPALKKGDWVLCDRFTDATYAYQLRDGDLSENFINTLVEIVHSDGWPDLTFWLDVPLAVAQQRIHKKGVKNRFDAYSIDKQQKIYEVYAQRYQRFPERIKRIDAESELKEILEQVINYLKPLV